jgi:hypothetical protein
MLLHASAQVWLSAPTMICSPSHTIVVVGTIVVGATLVGAFVVGVSVVGEFVVGVDVVGDVVGHSSGLIPYTLHALPSPVPTISELDIQHLQP